MPKKVIYLHGLSSSGTSTTAQRLRRSLKGYDVISPDIPTQPEQAMIMLRDLARALRRGDVVTGTSQGAFYAQMFRGWHRLLINPAFHSSVHLREHLGSRLPFHNPRKDGATSFEVTERICKKLEEVEARQFDPKFGFLASWADDPNQVEAFFGTNDTVVNCKDEYLEHYSRFTDFEGGHRLDPDTTLGLLLPRIREILKQ